jgi:two-component system secretion response regulator SsrB
MEEGVRGLLKTAFGTVVMVADDASLLGGSVPGPGQLPGLVASASAALPRPQGVLLSVHDEGSARSAAMEAGADAFVLKRAIVIDFLPATEAVRGGRSAYWTKGQLTAHGRRGKIPR